MNNVKPDVNSSLGFLERILKLYKEYGVFGILKGLFILLIFSFTLRICFNPEFLFEKYSEYVTTKHNQELIERSKLDEELKKLLPLYSYKYRSDRVWIIQYHNGIMDWQHGTMRFEYTKKGISSIKKQYNDFNLTWLDLPYYLREHDIFIGNLEDIGEIDPTLHAQLLKNKIHYLACTLIRDDQDTPIGILGFTWETIPSDIETFYNKIKTNLIEDRAEVKVLIQLTNND